ncbi:DUF4960 domain-containing protein [Mangrovibacterium lignilyticum]|uniref:DUF4960 domain-containing protein n=1 Tax=Mangrovibacterium lignilyticum TaxID=2668052 RepID=UPI0013CFA518|nr:DUF4960 domain-containing protein [Mangrovibacterium lignilyticum]
MKKHITQSLLFFFLAAILATSCEDEYKSNMNFDYDVTIKSFSVEGIVGVIDEKNKTVTVTVESSDNIDVSDISPQIVIPEGATITPEITSNMDFTSPIDFTIVNGNIYTKYTIIVSEKFYFAFLGEPSSVSAMTIMDDQKAAEWFLAKYPDGEYVSFSKIADGSVDLSKYDAVWYHSDQGTREGNETSQALTGVADNPEIVSKLKEYYDNGGNILLTSYAGSLVDELGVVSDAMHAPNNAWGDTEANPESANWGDWDLKWYTDPDSPLASGLSYKDDDPTKFIMLPNGVARRNRTNQYNLADWTIYSAGGSTIPERVSYFETVNSCKVLVTNWNSEEINMVLWDKHDGKGTVIFIGSGTYDWYAENDVENTAGNREKLTSNSLNYLFSQSKN